MASIPKFANNFTTTLTQNASVSSDKLYLDVVDGLPDISGGNFFRLTIKRESDGAREIVKVTSVDTISRYVSVERGDEGGTPLAFVVGDEVQLRLTAEPLNDIFVEVDRLTTAETNLLAASQAAIDSADAAETSAVNALDSEQAAATSEANALASEQAAALSESNAANSATAANNSRIDAEAAQSATESIYDQFDDRYLGDKESDPTLDNDGDALQVGALYFNSTSDKMREYTGTVWQDVSPTASELLSRLLTVDGAGSGLDADLLDGQDSPYYLDWTNFTNKPDPTITVTGDATGSVTLTDVGDGTLSISVVDDSHNHVIGNVDGLQVELDERVYQDSTTGAAQLPTGTIAQRPAVPVEGMFRRNSETGAFEGYDGASWSVIADSAGTVLLTGDQTIAGVKTFATKPNVNGDDVLLRPEIVGTVSQSGGVPTGAIIERGSNANGEFVRFADGTQICTGSTLPTVEISDTGSGTYRYRYDQRSSDFAAIFVSVPNVAVTFANNSVYAVAGVDPSGGGTTTTNTGRIRGSSNSPAITNSYYAFIAIGRWY